MKSRYVLAVVLILVGGFLLPEAFARTETLRGKLLGDAGKTFEGPNDPGYVSYDQNLRQYAAKRILQRYGVQLDGKNYSGFELLEIEAFLKCKKAGEDLGPFLTKFQKRP